MHVAAVRLDDAVDDGEAETGACTPRGEEGVEHALEHVGRDSRPAVGHADDNASGAAALGQTTPLSRRVDLQSPIGDLHLRQGLGGIADHVAQRLHEKRRVGLQQDPSLGRPSVHRNAGGVELRPAALKRQTHEIAGLDSTRLDRRLACETQDVANDGVDPLDRPRDATAEIPLLGSIEEILGQHLHIEPDGPQGVAHLVGDAGRHLAQRRQLAGAAQLGVRLGELALQPGDLPLQGRVRALQTFGRLIDRTHELTQIVDVEV